MSEERNQEEEPIEREKITIEEAVAIFNAQLPVFDMDMIRQRCREFMAKPSPNPEKVYSVNIPGKGWMQVPPQEVLEKHFTKGDIQLLYRYLSGC